MTSGLTATPATGTDQPPTEHEELPGHSDLVIVGAGITGLSHAWEAVRRGMSVTVVERDWHPVGASVRNFGHCCITAQHGELLDVAYRSRTGWLRAARTCGFWAEEAGAYTVARTGTELAVLEELRAERGAAAVRLQTAEQIAAVLGRGGTGPGESPTGIVGGAFLPDDLRVNPRTAPASLAGWLAAQPGVRLLWGTSVNGVQRGTVHTSRGPVSGEHILVCVGHDLDRLFPEAAEEHGTVRCRLSMARVRAPERVRTNAAVLTNTSMLRYGGFTAQPSAARLRQETAEHSPQLLGIGANLMFTRLPDGTLLAGDSHDYGPTASPFVSEHTAGLLLDALAELLGTGRLDVLERWQGVYASSPQGPLLVREVTPGVRAVSVTSGIGMTLAFGLAAGTFDNTLQPTG